MAYVKQAGSLSLVPTGQVFASLKSHHLSNLAGSISKEAKDKADTRSGFFLLTENQKIFACFRTDVEWWVAAGNTSYHWLYWTCSRDKIRPLHITINTSTNYSLNLFFFLRTSYFIWILILWQKKIWKTSRWKQGSTELTRPKFGGGSFVLFLHTVLIHCYLKETTQTVDKEDRKCLEKKSKICEDWI